MISVLNELSRTFIIVSMSGLVGNGIYVPLLGTRLQPTNPRELHNLTVYETYRFYNVESGSHGLPSQSCEIDQSFNLYADCTIFQYQR
jgi:hypothetical protein